MPEGLRVGARQHVQESREEEGGIVTSDTRGGLDSGKVAKLRKEEGWGKGEKDKSVRKGMG